MIGLGTYAFFWQHSDRALEPLSLIGALEATARWTSTSSRSATTRRSSS